jgi:glycerol-3-phosphate dehydrogenase
MWHHSVISGRYIRCYMTSFYDFRSLYQMLHDIILRFQVAIPDVKEAAEDADILIFVLPHQFVRGVCKQLDGRVKKSAIAVSLIKVRVNKSLLLRYVKDLTNLKVCQRFSEF